jgi:hypothetical protein
MDCYPSGRTLYEKEVCPSLQQVTIDDIENLTFGDDTAAVSGVT